MKQCAKFQFIFLFFVAFFLLFSLPAQGQPMSVDEIEYELGGLGEDIFACEEECDRIDLEISDLEIQDVAPQLDGYDFIESEWYCDYKPKLNELKKELDKLANPGANVTVPEEERKKIEELKVKLVELEERNDNLQKRRKEFEARIKKLKESARNSEVSETASEIAKEVKRVLEKEFGVLKYKITHDEIKMWGHLIGIEYWKLEGKLLDDTWRPKTVKALALGGITAMVEGNSVRADGQKIAGNTASSIQFLKAEDIEGEALITLTINVLRKKVKKY